MFEAFKIIAMLCGMIIMLAGTVVLVMIATRIIEDVIEDYVSSNNRR